MRYIGVEFALKRANFMVSAMTRKILYCMVAVSAFCSATSLRAQDCSYDVFNPISKYMGMGDAVRLSAWFADNLEISIFSNTNDTSKSQALQIMKSFFKSYTPRSCEITHKAGKSNMKYAVGILNAGGEIFNVTIFVNYRKSDNCYQIQQIKIERN